MALTRLRPLLAAAAALGLFAGLPAGATASGPAGPPPQAREGATSGHSGDPSGPPPAGADAGAAPADAPAPASAPPAALAPDAAGGEPAGVTRATPGDTFDVVASARPARVSRRAFTIRIARGIHVASAQVWVDGRPAPVRHGRRTTARIDLRGRPKGRVTVRIRVRTREGAVLEASRAYRTCAARRAGGVPSV